MVSGKKHSRRNFLHLTAGAMGLFGAGAASWMLLDTMNPAADAVADVTVQLDWKSMKPSERASVILNRPRNLVFVYRRSVEELKEIRAEDWRNLRDPESDESRVKKGQDEWLVVHGVCTRLGCTLLGNGTAEPKGRWGGWFCNCCGSAFDRSGRVRSGPAPKNMTVMDYEFFTDHLIRIINLY